MLSNLHSVLKDSSSQFSLKLMMKKNLFLLTKTEMKRRMSEQYFTSTLLSHRSSVQFSRS